MVDDLIGRFAPISRITPPGYFLRSLVLSLPFSSAGRMRLRNGAVCARMGSKRVSSHCLASSSVGKITSIEPAASQIQVPIRSSPVRLPPTCSGFIHQPSRHGVPGDMVRWMSYRYGVRARLTRPG